MAMLRLSARATFVAFALAHIATPAWAYTDCEDAWLSRNKIFADAGYCFSSNLGRAVFGNEGCTGKDVSLSAVDQELVDSLLAFEAGYRCDLDTSETRVFSDRAPFLLELDRQPVRSSEESGCMAWRGQPVPLYASPAGQRQVGEIKFGNSVLFQYQWTDSAEPVAIFDRQYDTIVAIGWLTESLDMSFCEGLAG